MKFRNAGKMPEPQPMAPPVQPPAGHVHIYWPDYTRPFTAKCRLKDGSVVVVQGTSPLALPEDTTAALLQARDGEQRGWFPSIDHPLRLVFFTHLVECFDELGSI